MSPVPIHTVGIAIDGQPTYEVDVPTTLGREAAERRAIFAIASQHQSIDLDRITVCPTANDQEATQ